MPLGRGQPCSCGVRVGRSRFRQRFPLILQRSNDQDPIRRELRLHRQNHAHHHNPRHERTRHHRAGLHAYAGNIDVFERRDSSTFDLTDGLGETRRTVDSPRPESRMSDISVVVRIPFARQGSLVPEWMDFTGELKVELSLRGVPFFWNCATGL